MTAGGLLRDRSGDQRVTNIELFFDLVYVFAVTQLSHFLLGHATAAGALRAALLLAMVWLVWAYTTWVTNWMDPERIEVRLLLVVLMLISLAMSAALPRAFAALGAVVGAAYAVQQVGRSVFMVAALTGPLRRNFQRILTWCAVSGSLALAGGLTVGVARESLWVLAVAVDVAGGLVGFAVPGLGRSSTADWTIEGGHFAERCQAFILIALGESIVITGAALSGMPRITAAEVAAFVVAFAGSVALWWLYFDRSAAASARIIAASGDPGRLGRSAYHLIHPAMVAGIIVTAAGDEKILLRPASAAAAPSAWMILGGPALFLAGHAAFKYTIWRVIPWTRMLGIVVLALLALAAPVLAETALAACAAAVVIAVAAADRRVDRLPRPRGTGSRPRPYPDRVAGGGVQVDIGVAGGVGVVRVRRAVARGRGDGLVRLVRVDVDVIIAVVGVVGGPEASGATPAPLAHADAEPGVLDRRRRSLHPAVRGQRPARERDRGYSSSSVSMTTLMLSLASRNEMSSRLLAIENSR